MTSTADAAGNGAAAAVLYTTLAGERGEHPQRFATSTASPPLTNRDMTEAPSTQPHAESLRRQKRKSESTKFSRAKRASLAKDVDIQPHLLKLLPPPEVPGIFPEDVSELYDKIPREGDEPLPDKSKTQIRIALLHMVECGMAHRAPAQGRNNGKTFTYWQQGSHRNSGSLPVIVTPAGTPASTNRYSDSYTGQHDDASQSSRLQFQQPRLLWHSQSPLPDVAALEAAVQGASDEHYDPTESSVNLINTASDVGRIDGGTTENTQAQKDVNDLKLLNTARCHKTKQDNVRHALLELKVQMEQAGHRGVQLERQMRKEKIDKEELGERVRHLQEELRQAEVVFAERSERVIKLEKEAVDNRRDQEIRAADVAHTEGTLAEVEAELQKVNEELGL